MGQFVIEAKDTAAHASYVRRGAVALHDDELHLVFDLRLWAKTRVDGGNAIETGSLTSGYFDFGACRVRSSCPEDFTRSGPLSTTTTSSSASPP